MAGLLWALIVLLFVFWFVGFVVIHVTAPLLHILLIIALVLLVWNLLSPRAVA